MCLRMFSATVLVCLVALTGCSGSGGANDPSVVSQFESLVGQKLPQGVQALQVIEVEDGTIAVSFSLPHENAVEYVASIGLFPLIRNERVLREEDVPGEIGSVLEEMEEYGGAEQTLSGVHVAAHVESCEQSQVVIVAVANG